MFLPIVCGGMGLSQTSGDLSSSKQIYGNGKLRMFHVRPSSIVSLSGRTHSCRAAESMPNADCMCDI